MLKKKKHVRERHEDTDEDSLKPCFKDNRDLKIDVFDYKRQTANAWESRDQALELTFEVFNARFRRQQVRFHVCDFPHGFFAFIFNYLFYFQLSNVLTI